MSTRPKKRGNANYIEAKQLLTIFGLGVFFATAHYSHLTLIFSGQTKLQVINPYFVRLIYKCFHVLKSTCGL